MNGKKDSQGEERSQSSLELLITIGFGLMILIPVMILAFLQVSSTPASLSVSAAQTAANKLASAVTAVGTQGAAARQTVVLQIPPNIQGIYVGSQNNQPGHEIIFAVKTGTGLDYITAYTAVNASGYLEQLTQSGTYIINVSSMGSCPSLPSQPCVYLSAQNMEASQIIAASPTTCYGLSVAAGPGGAVSYSPPNSIGCSTGSFFAGNTVTLTATNTVGYSFTGWTGSSSSGSDPWQYTMPPSSATETAGFSHTCYQLTLSASAGGTFSAPSPANSIGCSPGYFFAGATTTLTASANFGYYFALWTGTIPPSPSSSDPWTYPMPATSATEEANFFPLPTFLYGWQTTNSLASVGVTGLSCVTDNSYIYCMGGFTGSSSINTVQYAQILSNGLVSKWHTTNSLIDAYDFQNSQGCVISGSYIDCMGGVNSIAVSNTVQYAQVLGNGLVSTWHTTNALNGAGLNGGEERQSCDITGGYIYCMGSSYSPKNRVESAQVLGNGLVSTWQTTASLNTPDELESCVTDNSYIYCMGGADSSSTVQSSHISGGGSLATWYTADSLYDGDGSPSCVISGSNIYCMGIGLSPAENIAQYTQTAGGGTVSTWQTTNTPSGGAGDSGSCVTSGIYVYCMGAGYTNTVQSSQIGFGSA
jgi:hypothetical protein